MDLSGRVAIVTGAGRGLGRAHARLLAKRGAKVVVNDLGEAAQAVAAEIVADGGQAFAALGSVSDVEAAQAMVDEALGQWGRIDILVNNAGFLRDKSFAKMTLDDFRQVVDVHLMGAVICTKAVWETMRAQNYGRVVMTTSAAGLYGNFGQANYGAAKMALVGLMNTLAIEGAKNDIRVNCLTPTAATQMLEGLLPAEPRELLKPEAVSPGLLALVREDAPTKTILCAGAGGFELAYVTLTQGVHVGAGDDAAEQVAAQWGGIADRRHEHVPADAFAQARLELAKAGLNLEMRDVK
ncbi:MAG TPA: SDR family NAD(P)-dependent oxidoreductase [Phenylobacterium sp.]|uniref:SDR family NAD(P)-dependent oxidoreductase n=1 Tax=Phenylobacterium sp. TaxID=1871053 RepID=UPI002B49C254|nr:SDR family NAD(P)-dependent oxidoreductase [Phenylobacterium sp.]HKR87759.1 SDR family NAD(P)-dependent oxidoreductase [Phenylobacterium sp.]